LDKLVAMRALVEIVDRGSLTQAARHLGKSLPTVVRTLAQLEEHLGVRLLVRTTRRSSLTPEGRDYLERARRILADVDDAETALVAGQAEPQGTLKVTAPVRFGQMHVAPGLIELARRHPALTVDLVLLDRVVDLVDEGFDASIRLAPLADSSMVGIPVGEVRRLLVASPALLESVDAPRAPTELASLPCVRFSGTAPGDVWTFEHAGARVRVPVAGAFRSNDAASSIEACVAGVGFGQFLSYQVAPVLADGRLVEVLPDDRPPAVPVTVVYPQARLVSSRLRVFLDAMRVHLRTSLGAL